MNRHERRQKRKRERQAAKQPASETFPPGYVAVVERMVQLIPQWIRAEPSPPDLRWLDRGKTIFAGSLGEPRVQRFLADSPDAFRLLAWLDEQTGREGTLFQADCALRHLGLLGAPPPEIKQMSAAMRRLMHFAKATGTDSDLPPSPCGHCGVLLEKASGEPGHVPEPGMFSICVRCAGLSQYGAALELIKVSDDELESADIPEDFRASLREQQAILRHARLTYKQKPGKVARA